MPAGHVQGTKVFARDSQMRRCTRIRIAQPVALVDSVKTLARYPKFSPSFRPRQRQWRMIAALADGSFG